MKKNVLISIAVVLLVSIFIYLKSNGESLNVAPVARWKVSSVDTVKYSRDLAREKGNSSSFEQEIDRQVKNIAETGATHISIGTPYDSEFVPFLSKWVRSARKYKLNVWFRGNFSGWEGWFDHQKISRDEHKKMLAQFITDNGNLFEDGDVFTSCPECENGGPGDPRHNNDLSGHRQFLIDEYQISKDAFRKVGKNVSSNYFPMNGDVAKLVMNIDTTRSLGGIVTVDHYVKDPEKLNQDLTDIAQSSGGKVVLGEFGAPIPDIHGKMSEDDQAMWIDKTMSLIAQNTNVIGINYWTNIGGSTQIWNVDGTPKKSVSILQKYFKL